MKAKRMAAAAGVGLVVLVMLACNGINLASLVPGTSTGAGRPTVAKIGDLAPEIDLKSMTGDQIVLSQLQGRPVLVNFWATWCGPCREEFPALGRAYKKYQSQGLVVLGVNTDDPGTDDLVRTFMLNSVVTFPIVRDQDDRVGGMYRVNGLPTSIFVDRKGIVRDIVVGGPMTDDFIDQQFAKINQ